MKKKFIIFLLSFFVGISLLISVIYYLLPKFIIDDFSKEIFLDYQEEYKEDYGNICYGNLISCKKPKVISIGEVDTNVLGIYEKKYIYNYKDEQLVLYQKINVIDKEKPTINIESDYASICLDGKINELNVSALDNYDNDLTDKIEMNYKDNKVFIKVKDSSGNIREDSIDAKIEDKEKPNITLNGKETIYLKVGETYNEEGAISIDNCDEIETIIEGNVDVNTPGTYIVKYRAIDKSNNESVIERKINVYNPVYGSRIVYLTFDDGPSIYTSKLLDVLRKYNVKATFFVTGNGSDEMILREFNEGHSIGLHTYSHDYSYIYSCVEAFFNDLNNVQQRVKNITGQETYLMRFAGGSSNLVSAYYDGGTKIMSTLVKETEKRGFKYFDWNVSSGDAGSAYSSDEVYYNVISTLKEEYSVVLQHDIKGFSVDAVESIIKYGLANGYRFEKLDMSSPGAHHGVNN